MRPARPLALVVLLVLLSSAAGCSGGPGARVWAAAVCTTLDPWRTEISALTGRTQQLMSAATTPGQAKENLMRLFSGAADASERARAGVAKAGVPDVEQGREIADGFTGSLAAVRDAYGRARSGVEGLKTAPANTFYQEVSQVVEKLQSDYQASSLDTSNLKSQELQEAFDEVPECR